MAKYQEDAIVDNWRGGPKISSVLRYKRCNAMVLSYSVIRFLSRVKLSLRGGLHHFPRNRFDITRNWSIIHFLLSLGRNCMTRIVNQLMTLLAIKKEKWFQQLLPLLTKDKAEIYSSLDDFLLTKKGVQVCAELLLQCLCFCGRKTCFKNVSYQTISLPCEAMHACSNSTFCIVAATYSISP